MNFLAKEQAQEFNPELFGFDASYCRRTKGNPNAARDYLLIAKNDGREQLQLSLSRETSVMVEEMFGDSVNFATNKKGEIVLWEGQGRKLSSPKGLKCGNRTRTTISMGLLTVDYITSFGKFKRLYLTPSIYANGLAILFKPTGERDEQ